MMNKPTTAGNNNPKSERMKSMISKIGLVLLIIGGLNWGLVGLANFDLVAFLFGSTSLLTRAVYILVAVGAVLSIPLLTSDTNMGNGEM